jgi:hypothetical protein
MPVTARDQVDEGVAIAVDGVEIAATAVSTAVRDRTNLADAATISLLLWYGDDVVV